MFPSIWKWHHNRSWQIGNLIAKLLLHPKVSTQGWLALRPMSKGPIMPGIWQIQMKGVAPPTCKSKCCCLSSSKLDKILDTVEVIKERNDVIEKISGLYECERWSKDHNSVLVVKELLGANSVLVLASMITMHAHIAPHLVSLTIIQTSGVLMICWGLFVYFMATVLIMALLSRRQLKMTVVTVVTSNYQQQPQCLIAAHLLFV